MTYRHLQAARSVALASPGTGKRNSYKVGAILFKGKNIYAARHNELKTHPKLSKFSEFPFLHAESNCVISHGISHSHGLDLICTRVLADGSLTMSKPCPVCETFLDHAGIRKVFYTNWEGEVIQL